MLFGFSSFATLVTPVLLSAKVPQHRAATVTTLYGINRNCQCASDAWHEFGTIQAATFGDRHRYADCSATPHTSCSTTPRTGTPSASVLSPPHQCRFWLGIPLPMRSPQRCTATFSMLRGHLQH